MTELTNDKFKKLLAVVSESFDKTISTAQGRIYWDALKVHSAEAVESALGRAIRELKFFPHLAELLEFIEGSPKARAEISWAGVMELLNKYGHDYAARKKFMVDGATAWAVERMGGLEGLCRMRESDLHFSRPRYIALYERAVTDGRHLRPAEIYGLFIELKKTRGGRVSPEQAEWKQQLQAQGYRVEICEGFEAAKQTIMEYLS